MEPGHAKIFGIGLSKTGTSSLANALAILGYAVKDNMGVTRYARGDLGSLDQDLLDTHDAFTDTPIPSFYRELDATYAGARFILTVRETGAWLESCKKQFSTKHAEKHNDAHKALFHDLYGCNTFDAALFRQGYERFVAGVHEYFAHRPEDLLVMDIAAGDGWEKLCAFLDRPVPEIPFPKTNVTRVRWIAIDDVAAIARQAGAELLRHHPGRTDTSSVSDGERPDARAAAFEALKRVSTSALDALRGGADGRSRRAGEAAHRVIVKGLTRLTADIPIVSSRQCAPYSERRRWNHVWLIEPLDGAREFRDGGRSFTVNIALIEDGKPICGVVYAPALDTIYYAKVGKGTFKATAGGDPRRLGAPAPASAATAGDEVRTCEGMAVVGDGPTAAASLALALCRVAEGMQNGACGLHGAMEWQAAAGQVIAECAGLRITDERHGELTYNLERMGPRALMAARGP